MKRLFMLFAAIAVAVCSYATIVQGTIGEIEDSYGLDFNNDGVLEFVIYGNGFNPDTYGDLHTNSYLMYDWSDGGNNIWAQGTIDTEGWDIAQNLNYGTSIGSNGQWEGQGDCSIINWEDQPMVPINTDCYLGFRISLGTGNHYGWAKIRVTGSSTAGYNVSWLQIAYETTPSTAINAGSLSGVTPTTYTITASAGNGGSISPNGSVTANSGENKTFTITANSGFQIASVSVDGVNQGAISTYTFSNITTNHTIAATFSAAAPTTYTITASAGNGGSISPNGSVSVNSGENKTFTITANSGFQIASVSVDGVNQGAIATYTFSNITTNHTIAATFTTASTPTYTITASAGNGGSISPNGSISVTSGANQAFTITANSGFQIASVSVDGVNQGAISTYTFSNITANHTIAATFSAVAPTTYTITASAGNGGSISPNGSVSVNSGENKTFTITANPGFQIASVSVDGVSQGAIATYTFSNITTNHTIAATFSAIGPSYTITAVAGANGTISPNGSVSVVSGTNQVFYITANIGYQISALYVDDIEQPITAMYTFYNVTSNHTITVSFESLVDVEEISEPELIVYGIENAITIENAESQMVNIFDLTGRIVVSKVQNNNTEVYDIPRSGIYIVKVGDKTVKTSVL